MAPSGQQIRLARQIGTPHVTCPNAQHLLLACMEVSVCAGGCSYKLLLHSHPRGGVLCKTGMCWSGVGVGSKLTKHPLTQNHVGMGEP